MLLDEVLRRVDAGAMDGLLICEAEPLDEPGPRIVHANDVFLQHTGYALQDLVGDTPRLLQGPETDRAAIKRMGEKLRRWEHVRECVINYRKDGSAYWVDLSIVPVPDEKGHYRYWTSFQRELTDYDVSDSEGNRVRTHAGYAATHDALTGLLNRHGLRDAIDYHVAQKDQIFGLLCLDLDHFKSINDIHGHLNGDRVLKETASRLRSCLKPTDLAVRFGGDEFLVLRPGAARSELENLGEQLIDCIGSPIDLDKLDCQPGISLGIATGTAWQLQSDILYRQADQALQVSKSRGRNRYQVFTDGLADKLMLEDRIATDLPSAIENEEFEIFLMPQVRASDRQMTSYEALARWQHPVLGTILPNEFMPVINKLDIIRHLDRFVLRRSMALQKRLVAVSNQDLKISVNLAVQSLLDKTFHDDIDRIAVAPGNIVLKLSGQCLLDLKSTHLIDVLERLKRQGFQTELHSFGTPVAPINSLIKVQPDRLKLNRCIIEPINQSERRRRIVRSMIEIAHTLDVSVVAEGVETEQQAHTLTELGCDILQGYLVGEPLPADQVLTSW